VKRAVFPVAPTGAWQVKTMDFAVNMSRLMALPRFGAGFSTGAKRVQPLTHAL